MKKVTKQEYIQEAIKSLSVSKEEAEKIVNKIMKHHGYVTDKNGIICTVTFNK